MDILLANCDILVPSDGGYETLKNAFLGTEGDKISYIGMEAPAERPAETKDMTGKLLIPGLINAHTHTPMCLLRGVGGGLPLQEWLFDKVFPIEDRLTRSEIKAGSALAVLEMLACGTTSFSDMYMEPEATLEVVAESGMKANLTRPVQSFDPHERGEDSYRVRESLDLFKKYNGCCDGRIRIDFCIHAEYTCTEAVTEYYSALCRELSGNMHVHLSETLKEHNECIEKYGKTPARWFFDLGAFGSSAFCAHCVHVSDEDIALMAENSVAAVHNPSSNMKLGSGFAPVRKMLDAGMTVGLGTDGAASNNNLNMPEEMHLVYMIHSGYTGTPGIIKPSEIIRMATAGGAAVQGRSDTGELKIGKKADIAAINMDSPHLVPNLDTQELICSSVQGSDICMTMADGRILYENGEYLTLDRERIIWEAGKEAEKLYSNS